MTTTTEGKVATPYDRHPDDQQGVHNCRNCGTRIDVVLLDDQPGTAGWVHDHNGQADCDLVRQLAHSYDARTLIEALAYQLTIPVPF